MSTPPFGAAATTLAAPVAATDTRRLLLGLIVLGVLAFVLLHLAGDPRSWLGRLPGDVRIERDGFRFYLPITTALLVSLVLSLAFSASGWLLPRLGEALLWLFGWFGRLPGDVRLQGDGWAVFLPFASGLVLSVLLSAFVALVRWWRGRR